MAMDYDLLEIEANNNNIDAIVKLGNYYRNIKNYDLMKKYYTMAINRGHYDLLYLLGDHYRCVEKNYVLMKKYYLIGIDNGDRMLMYELGDYYNHIEINYKLMKQYYLMSITNKYYKAINYFSLYYFGKNMYLERLEFYLNYQNEIHRGTIINLFCYNANYYKPYNNYIKLKLLQLIDNFDFHGCDKLNSELLELIKK